jgi:hypothetical protein
MSAQYYYQVCSRYKGRNVRIVTRDGKVYEGIIEHVDQQKVYLRQMGGRPGLGGYGYGFWGPGFGYGRGLLLGVGLGAIGTLALAPLFWI